MGGTCAVIELLALPPPCHSGDVRLREGPGSQGWRPEPLRSAADSFQALPRPCQSGGPRTQGHFQTRGSIPPVRLEVPALVPPTCRGEGRRAGEAGVGTAAADITTR